MNELKQLFAKIKTNQERLDVFKQVIFEKSAVVCKGSGEFITKVAPLEISIKNEIICKLATGELAPSFSSEAVTCFVIVSQEKYYFQTTLTKVGNHWNLKIPEDLYHLQRRQNFRLRIPSSYSSQFLVQEWNRNRSFFKVPIKDISIGGCAIIVTPQNLPPQLNTEVIGKIEISGKDPISVIAYIKHWRPGETPQSTLVGLEFNLKAVPGLERKLFSLTLDLYRELIPIIKVA